ncbi:MAG: hypothetical protein OIF57_01645 [Marinobacterium sp.]|nr:hypothetical protein [Marinobacterium sp.]
MKHLSLFLLLLITISSHSYSEGEPSAYDRARVKSLSNISDRYNYKVIRNKRDLKHQDDDVGINNSKARGYSTVKNIVDIKNVNINSSHLKNIGVSINCKNRGQISNHVNINNATINAGISGGVNSGINLTGCSNRSDRLNINNNVNIRKSRVGG